MNKEQDLIFDASGSRGQDGVRGANGRGIGAEGLPGSKGGPAEAAGHIALTASLGPEGLELRGEMRAPKEAAPHQSIHQTVPVRELQALRLLAVGGTGGNGGDGGEGGPGFPGFDGSDATRYSEGSSGGSGSDGGDGGEAGEGGAAGAGGKVELFLKAEDLDLALLFHWDVSAGNPGSPGLGGPGGQGGQGGQGGSSYSWTETETETDSDGNQQTRTVTRTNPGGRAGTSGRRGREGRSAQPGSRAENGKFTLWLNGQPSADRYRLRCLDYQVKSSRAGDLFEFGEKANRVDGVVLLNHGDAPSPPANVELHLLPRDGLVPHSEGVPVPTIAPGDKTVLSGLAFDLEEADPKLIPSLHERLRTLVSLEPAARFTRLDRHADEVSLPRQIEVTFPVELRTLPSAGSLVPGQVLMQRWILRNLSREEFPPEGRKLTVELCQPLEGCHLHLYDSDGNPLEITSEPRVFLEVDRLAPEQELPITVYLTFASDAPTYSSAELWAGLRLTPRSGGEPRLIQKNPVSFSAARAYRGDKVDVLLVTHAGIQPEEFAEWTDLLERLGLSWDVWDAAWHGDLPIQDLAPQLAGKLVVILNTPFNTPDDGETRPVDLLPLSEFRDAVSRYGISFYAVGSVCVLCQRLFPQPKEVRDWDSPSEYLKSFEREQRSNPEVPESMNSHLDRVAIRRFHLASEPTAKDLREEAVKLLDDLRTRFPDRRFAISTHFDPEGKSGWFRKKAYGHLEIRQLPDADARAVVVRQVEREVGQSPGWVRSSENLVGLFSAMDFDDKLGVANSLDESRRFAVEPLADAWLLDLGEEQMTLRRSGVHMNKKRIRELLNRTAELCRHDFRPNGVSLEVESSLGGLLVRLAAGLTFLAKSRLHWSDHRMRLLGGTNEVAISEVVAEMVDQLLDLNFGADPLIGKAPLARAKAEEVIAARSAELAAEAGALQEASAGNLSRKDSAVEALVRWDLRGHLETDSSLIPGLYSENSLAHLASDEEEAETRRATLLNLLRQVAEDSRLPEDAHHTLCHVP